MSVILLKVPGGGIDPWTPPTSFLLDKDTSSALHREASFDEGRCQEADICSHPGQLRRQGKKTEQSLNSGGGRAYNTTAAAACLAQAQGTTIPLQQSRRRTTAEEKTVAARLGYYKARTEGPGAVPADMNNREVARRQLCSAWEGLRLPPPTPCFQGSSDGRRQPRRVASPLLDPRSRSRGGTRCSSGFRLELRPQTEAGRPIGRLERNTIQKASATSDAGGVKQDQAGSSIRSRTGTGGIIIVVRARSRRRTTSNKRLAVDASRPIKPVKPNEAWRVIVVGRRRPPQTAADRHRPPQAATGRHRPRQIVAARCCLFRRRLGRAGEHDQSATGAPTQDLVRG